MDAIHMPGLRERMARAGVTQAELAPLVGIEYTALSHIFAGRRRAPDDFRFRVDDALEALEEARAAYRQVLIDRGYEVAP